MHYLYVSRKAECNKTENNFWWQMAIECTVFDECNNKNPEKKTTSQLISSSHDAESRNHGIVDIRRSSFLNWWKWWIQTIVRSRRRRIENLPWSNISNNGRSSKLLVSIQRKGLKMMSYNNWEMKLVVIETSRFAFI